MCGGKGGGGQSSNTTVTKSDPPEYVAKAYQDLLARATNVSETPYSAYTGETVAGLTPDQLAAFQSISNAQTITDPYYSAANEAIGKSTADVMSGVQDYSAENLQQYYNPYQQAVIEATMANIAENNAQQQTQLQGDAISRGAWGGDRSGVAAAELARQQGLAANQTLADLQSSGFTNAQSMLQSQNAQRIAANEAQGGLYGNAATAYGGLGTSAQTAALQGASTQLQSGALQQQQAQNELNAAYQEWLAQQSYPFETTQFLAQNVFGLNPSGTTTSTSTSPAASTVSQLGGIGLTGLSLYGAMSGAKDGGRIGYKRGGVAVPHGRATMKNDNHYLYGGATPYTRGLPNMATGYVPAIQSIRSPGANMMQPTGSTAKTTAPKQEPTLGQQAGSAAQTGIAAKNAIQGGKALAKTVSGWMEPGTGEAANAVWEAGAKSGASFADTLAGARAAESASLPAGFAPTASGVGALPEAGTTFSGASLAGQEAAKQSFLSGAAEAGLADTAASAGATDAAISGLTESALSSAATDLGATAALDAGAATGLGEAAAATASSAGAAGAAAAEAAAATTASTLAAAAPYLLPLAIIAPSLFEKGGRVKNRKKVKKLAFGGDAGDDIVADPYLNDEIQEELGGFSSYDPTVSSLPVSAPTTGVAAKRHEADPWQSALVTGLSMMAGESPNALTNIGRAGIAGVSDYTAQKRQAAEENYREGSIENAAKKLIQEAEWRKRQGDIQSEKNDIARANAQSLQGYRNRALAIQQQRLGNEMSKGDYDLYQWTTKDESGKTITGRSSYDGKTGSWLGNQAPPEGAVLEPIGRTKGEGRSVFDTKFDMAMRITGGDEKAAFDMASGIKQLSDAEIRKHAADYADKRMKDDMSNIGPNAEATRRRLIQEQIDFIKNGFPSVEKPKQQGASGSGTRENPLVPTTQSDIDNAPKGTVFKVNGKLMVK